MFSGFDQMLQQYLISNNVSETSNPLYFMVTLNSDFLYNQLIRLSDINAC